MKPRHIVMLIILILVISIVISNKGVENLVCTTNGTLYNSPSKSTLKISVKDNKIKNMNVSIDVTLSEELKKDKNEIIEMLKSQGKGEIIETKEGFRLTSGMDSSYFTNLGLSKDTKYKELKEVLEVQGFKCE